MPTLNHRQFFIVNLVSEEHSGRHIRDCLKAQGVHSSLPAFYQLMARLEADGLVKGRYIMRKGQGHILKERHYRSLAYGRRECQAVRDFYNGRG
jgi:DNA-binding PadR family transcriptional regulator